LRDPYQGGGQVSAWEAKVCAVILNLCSVAELRSCLAALDKCGYGNLEIIVVRNGPFVQELEDSLRKVTARLAGVIFTGSNLGFAAGNNPGIKEAFARGADYIFLLNDDAELVPGALQTLVSAALEHPEAGIVGPRIFYSSSPRRIWFSGATFNPINASFSFYSAGQEIASRSGSDLLPTDFISGCALLFGRGFMEKVGLMDERYFLYWEDADWGLRAIRAGYRPLVVTAATVFHRVSLSGGGENSPLKIYHKTRAQLLFASRHAPSAPPRLLYGFAKDILWLLLRIGTPDNFTRARAYAAGIADYLLGKTGPGPDFIWKK